MNGGARVWATATGAVALTAVMLALGPVAAFAKKKDSEVLGVLAREPVNKTAPVSINAKCPPKTQVVGGGFAGGGTLVGGPTGMVQASRVVILESRRLGKRTWHVSAIDLGNPMSPFPESSRSAEATAYCKAGEGKISQAVAVGTPSSSDAPSSATATCRRGSAIAGGFSLSPGPGPGFTYPALYESFRSGRGGWTSSATRNTQQSVRIASYAYCWHKGKPPPTRARTLTAGTVASPKCRDGTGAAAGGFRAASGTVIVASESEPIGREDEPFPVSQRWIAAQSDYPKAFVPLTVFTHCH